MVDFSELANKLKDNNANITENSVRYILNFYFKNNNEDEELVNKVVERLRQVSEISIDSTPYPFQMKLEHIDVGSELYCFIARYNGPEGMFSDSVIYRTIRDVVNSINSTDNHGPETGVHFMLTTPVYFN